jgi:ABC-type nitrate/sulfonate/bicarbonate transport system substrate-binding protein
MTSWRTPGTIVVVLISAFILTSCQSGKKEDALGTSSLTAVKVGHQPYIHALPTYVAQLKGFYKDAGLNPTITQFSGGPAQNEALGSDQWEVGTMGAPGAIFGGVAYGLHIIAFSNDETDTTDLWVRPTSPLAKIKGANPKYPDIFGTPDQYKGKTILGPTATTCHFVVIATLKAVGVKEKEVKMLHMDVAQAFSAFKAGQGDIAALWSPFGYLAEKEGWVKISSARAAGVLLPGAVVASDKAMKEKPELVRKWAGVYFRAVDEENKDRQQTANWLFNFEKDNGIKLSAEDALKEVTLRPIRHPRNQQDWFTKPANGGFSVGEKAIYDIVDFFIEQGRLKPEDKQKLIANKFVTDQFVKEYK